MTSTSAYRSDAGRPQWVEALAEQGLDPCITSAGHCWIRWHRRARMRYPPNDVAPIDLAERRELFRGHHALALSGHREVQPGEAPNAWLYLCRDPQYDISKLSANNRSKVRRGLRRHEVRQITPSQMLNTGYASMADSQRRNNLEPPSKEAFRRTWETAKVSDHRQIWGAMVQEEVAAYMIVRLCGPWAEIASCGSANAHLKNYPNHAMFTVVLKELLSRPEIESISYGLSSAQLDTHANTLHSYKLSLRFEAIPVVRELHVHPMLKPIMNPATRSILRLGEKLFPDALKLRQARALVEMLTGGQKAPLPGCTDAGDG